MFRLVPLVAGSAVSFAKWNGIGRAPLDRPCELLRAVQRPVFQSTIINTFKVLVTLPIWVGLPLMLAIFIHF